MVFVVPPSLDELRRRLVGRATEVSEALERRWHNAAYELLRQSEYDHVVVNETGQADRSAEEIEAIIAEEHRRFPDRRLLA
jgi:guanylate kinase